MVNFKYFSHLFFAFVLTFTAAGLAEDVTYESGVVIVKFRSQGSERSLNKSRSVVQPLLRQYSVNSVEKLFPEQQPPADKSATDLSAIHVLRIPESYDPLKVAQEFARHDNIEYAQPNYIQTAYKIPNDPLWDDLYHLPQIQAPAAWDITQGDSSVVVAIIDTGVDYDHKDLKDNIWTNEDEILDGIDNDGNGKVDDIHGWDFLKSAANAAAGEDDEKEDNDPDDGQGHGTMVAGLAAGVTNNNIGVASIGWNCEIMPLRAGYKNTQGSGSINTLAANKAIKYAVDNGAHIINASYGAPVNDEVSADVMRAAFERNVVVIKAAGNSNSSQAYLPDAAPYVMTVAAVDDRDKKAIYSNYGEWISISAPGGNLSAGRPGVISTFPNDTYTQMQGTSISAPIVAGACGLVRAARPDWTAAKVMMHIVDTADDIYGINPGFEGMLGRKGRVNVLQSVQQNFNSPPEFSIDQVSVVDITGNGDGKINPGETVRMVLKIKNSWNDAKNVHVSLSSTDPTVDILRGETDFPTILGLSTPGFNFMENTHQPFRIKVDERTFPHNLPFTIDISTSSGYRQTIDFQVAIDAQVLFVDDDGPRQIEKYYFSVLDSIGMPYDTWNRLEQGPVQTARLRKYPIVIWSCEKTLPTLNEDDRESLKSYLIGGGKLFIAGQDIGWDLNDPQQDGQITNYNEYLISRGASQVFYELHFRAVYIDDKSPFSFVTGQDNDPIGRGLEFAVFEPGRSNTNQSPDVISPKSESTSIFNYPDGTSAAVRYDGDYQLVYFSFGGIQAISQESARTVVMERILNFFTGLQVKFTDIPGTEQTESDFQINTVVKTDKAIDSVRLFYRTSNESYFNVVPMTKESDSDYVASIPAQNFGTTVNYTVLAESEDGFYSPPTFRQFTVKYTPPELTGLTLPENTLFAKPFLKMRAFDASGIDSTSGYLHFWQPGQPHDSIALDYLGNDEFGQFISQHSFGDSVNYQFSVKDLSAKKLTGYSDVFSIKLGFEDFENEPLYWNFDESPWGRETLRAHSGNYAIHESPGQGVNYPDSADVSVRLERGLDLSGLSEATLSFYHFYGLLPGDSAFVEASRNGGESWQRVSDSFTGGQSSYKKYQCSLDAFTGAGNDAVLLRFRLVSDESGAGPGWFVDDVRIMPYSTVVEEKAQSGLPQRFALYDNYPNPFNNSTAIRYSLPKSVPVKIEIFNLLGHKVATLVDSKKESGVHEIQWNGQSDTREHVSTGLYFYRITAGKFRSMKKCALVK